MKILFELAELPQRKHWGWRVSLRTAGSVPRAGAADGSLRIWDRRKIGGKDAAMFTFDLHTEALMHVEWCPHRPGVVASCGEDKA